MTFTTLIKHLIDKCILKKFEVRSFDGNIYLISMVDTVKCTNAVSLHVVFVIMQSFLPKCLAQLLLTNGIYNLMSS